jgi:alpha-tubulin suppressor-like RCC1 family protein
MKQLALVLLLSMAATSVAGCAAPEENAPVDTAQNEDEKPGPGDGDGDGKQDDDENKEEEPQNQKPVVASVTIAAGNYSVTSEVSASVTASDPDGDAVTLSYEWLVNGSVVSTAEKLSGLFQKHDSVAVRVTASDGDLTSAPVTSNQVTILNSVPSMTGVSIGVGPYDTDDLITATPTGFTDADNDTPAYVYTWYVNGVAVSGEVGASLDGAHFDKGNTVYVTAAPSDGEAVGDSFDSGVVTIQNSAPTLSAASIGSGPYYTLDTISVTPTGYSDPDGDLPQYSYVWYVNDMIVPGENGASLVGSNFQKGDRVYVRVTPSDGTVSGTFVDSGELTIQNSLPTLSGVTLSGTPAYTDSILTAAPAGYSDDDQEGPSSYQYTWYVNGTAVKVGADDWLNGDSFDKGNTVYVAVRAYDGQAYSPAVNSSAITVLNSAPTLSQVLIPTNTPYYTNSSIGVLKYDFYDKDGDSTEIYTYQWFVDDAEVTGETTDTLDGAHFNKGQDVYVVITPSDGTSQGSAYTSNTVTIANSLPTVTSVSIGTGPYYTNDTITGTASATDLDGDTITYDYFWYVDLTLEYSELAQSATSSDFNGAVYFSKGDSVRLGVRVNDAGGTTGSIHYSNDLVIENSPPSAPSNLYWRVYEGGALEGEPDQISDAAEDLYFMHAASTDPDGDPITYNASWKRNGTEFKTTTSSGLSQSIDQTDIIGGTTIQVDLSASDGVLSSTSASLIGNISKSGLQFVETGLGPTTCAIDELGALTCWGANDLGQLGTGTSGGNFAHPQSVSGMNKDVIDVAVALKTACALKKDGTVWCWGQNSEGQLGNGTSDVSAHPTPAKITSLTNVTDIEAGYDHFCALHADTTASCWGWNENSQLGNPTAADPQKTPVKARFTNTYGSISDLTGVIKIQAGSRHTCALFDTGSIMCWGDDSVGQLGTSNLSDPWPTARTGFEVTGISTAVDIAVGQAHTCALLADGTVRCWGYNLEGQLGNGDKVTQTSPVQVKTSSTVNLTGVTGISGGRMHTCAQKTSGLVCWGADNVGQLGNDTARTSQVYASNHILMKTTALAPVQVSAGFDQTCAISKEGGLWCWGLGSSGQLANGSLKDSYIPVESVKHRDQNALSAGEAFGCALDRNGKLSCWGRNDTRQVANTATSEYLSPIATHYDRGVDAVATGANFACALLRTGAVTCWGGNTHKQVGLSTPLTPQGTPNQVIASGAVQVVAGSRHACAVLQDSTAKCWGDNFSGQLGRGTMTASETASAVLASAGVTLTGIAQMSAGGDHTCAVLSSGRVLCWGADNAGQLGNGGTTGSKAYGEDVLNSSNAAYANAVMVAAGYAHNCLITQSGALSCWGEGSGGQLGDSSSIDRTRAETTVSGEYLTVGGNIGHTCGAILSGAVYCWGTNSSGELGTNTGGITSTPAGVPSFSAKHLSLGDRFTLGHISTPYAWGRNENGRTGLGLSDTNFHNSRTMIQLP